MLCILCMVKDAVTTVTCGELCFIRRCMTTRGFKGHICVRVCVGIGASCYGANHTIHNYLLPIASFVKDIQEAICCMQV